MGSQVMIFDAMCICRYSYYNKSQIKKQRINRNKCWNLLFQRTSQMICKTLCVPNSCCWIESIHLIKERIGIYFSGRHKYTPISLSGNTSHTQYETVTQYKWFTVPQWLSRTWARGRQNCAWASGLNYSDVALLTASTRDGCHHQTLNIITMCIVM